MEGKNSTFSSFGREGHDGRQKIPVVRTAVKNTPSYPESRSEKARSISARGGNKGGVSSVFTATSLPCASTENATRHYRAAPVAARLWEEPNKRFASPNRNFTSV